MSYKPKYLQQKKLSDDDLSDHITNIVVNKEMKNLLDQIEDEQSDEDSSILEEYIPKVTDAPALKIRRLPSMKLNKLASLKYKSKYQLDKEPNTKLPYNSYCYKSQIMMKLSSNIANSQILAPKAFIHKNKTINTLKDTKNNFIILKRLQMEF